MSTAYGYTRVSSDSQAESGLSLSDQREQIKLQCKSLRKLRGLSIGHIYEDAAVSGSRYELRLRPEGERLDAVLQSGDYVVIAKLDRAFRNQRDCLNTIHEWERRGVVVFLLDLGVDTSTATGKLFLGILAAFAQWESARIGERIRDAKRAMRTEGRSVNGHRTLGHRVVRGKLVDDPAEKKLAKRVARLRASGKLWREISDQLNRERVRRPIRHNSQRLTKWNCQAVARLANSVARLDKT